MADHELRMQSALIGDDYLTFLIAMRDALVERFGSCSPGESAGLSRQIMSVSDKIQQIRDDIEKDNDEMSDFETQFNA